MMTLEEFKNERGYDNATPILQQYLDVKFAHQDCLLLFRLGDFFELFYDDAVVVSKTLGLTLTKRANKNEHVAMCGVPYHAIDTYIPKLLEEGYKIAICEQMETPEDAKKRGGTKAVVIREVVRVITPGTLYEENLLTDAPNYLMSIVSNHDHAGIAYVDISTLEFNVMRITVADVASEVMRISPREILISQNLSQDIKNAIAICGASLSVQVDSYFSESKCSRSIQDYYNISAINSIAELGSLEISAIGSVLQYLKLTQKNSVSNLGFPKLLNSSKFMLIDTATRKGLEIVSSNSGGIKGSLFEAMNFTNTRSGSRMLYRMLASPLTDLAEICYRHDLVDFFKQNSRLTSSIRSLLKQITDPERVLSRISAGRAAPRDLLALKSAIETANQIKQLVKHEIGFILPDILEKLFADLHAHDEICDAIDDAIHPDAFSNNGEIGYIKGSYHPRIEELGGLIDDSGIAVNNLRSKYSITTGIDTLKISQNNILGMFVEVTAKQVAKINTSDFIHRQTTLNSVRFTTVELQNLESKIINAKNLLAALEKEIFSQICAKVAAEHNSLVKMAEILSMLDVVSSLGFLAKEKNYIKPEMSADLTFVIQNGRHPVVENSLKMQREAFIANDADLSNGGIWIITGPNMSGKSTFLRQNAVLAIMAQAGLFVPASLAKIGVVDKLFSRIGASDDLSRGQSTFMVEMIETAAILAQATHKSLIILDEVGRGTSTYDGVSIAQSCLEYIHDQVRCRTLFATHYHELASLEKHFGNIKNYHISTKEVEHKLLFLHKIKPGAADKSYGINVAQLAGLPKRVIQRARDILDDLEKTHRAIDIKVYVPDAVDVNHPDIEAYGRLRALILSLDLDDMTPRQVLEQVYKIKDLC